MSAVTTDAESAQDSFATVISPLLFAGTRREESPSLDIVLSASTRGRSRATSRVRSHGVVLNARDLEVIASTLAGGSTEVRQIAASWLQRALMEARERRVSVVLEGAFGSSDLVSGIARLFESEGYTTHAWAVAERAAEVRMADASRAFDVHLRQAASSPSPAERTDIELSTVLAAVARERAVSRVTVLSRTGDIVLDAPRTEFENASVGDAMREAAAQPLGTLRSTLWLAELRRMTRLLSERRSVPAWAFQELVGLHEVALEDVVPGLPIAADAETREVQEDRLRAALAVLRESATSAARESATTEVRESGPPGPAVTPDATVSRPSL